MARRFALLLFLCALAACGSKNRDQLYAEGMKKFGGKEYEAAAVYFKNALEKDVNFVDARHQLARAYLELRRLDQAEKEFRKVALQDPSRHVVHLELARVYNGRREPDRALQEIDAFLAKSPESLDALEQKGIALTLRNEHRAAEELFVRVLRADPSRTAAKLELAALFLNQKRDDEGRRLLDEIIVAEPRNTKPLYMLATLETARGRSDKALEIYRRISAQDPGDPLARFREGAMLLEKGDRAKADAIADDLLKRFPKRSEGHRLKGLVQYVGKQYPEAITSFQNAVKIGPTVDGIYYLGLSLFHKGELENSLSQFRRILDVAPGFTNARLMSSLVLMTQKRFDDALSEVRRVLEQDPDNALAHNVLGSALIAKGEIDEGMKELNRATSLDPKIIDAHLKKGIVHLARGRVGEAELALSTAVQVAPEVLNTRLMLASFEIRQGKNGRAKEVLKGGLRGKEDDAVLYNSLAGIAFSEGKRDEALRHLARAKELKPRFAPSYYNLAAYYLANGERDKARAEYLSLLSVSPSDVRALLGLASLADLAGNDGEARDYYRKAQQTKAPQAYLAHASYLARKKEIPAALAVLDEAIAAIPRNLAAMEMKGRLLVSEKKTSEAVKIFDDIEQHRRGAGMALKIAAYLTARDFAKAEQEARRAVSLNPRSAGSYLVLASVFEAQKDIPRAISEIKNGLKADPGNPEALVALGNLHAARKEYDRAFASYQDALKSKGDFVPALFAQGTLLELQGKRKEAVGKYRQALTIDGTHVPSLNNLAYLLAKGEGRKEEALRLAVTAFKQKPNDAAVLDTLGYVLLLNGRQQDALKVLSRAAEGLGNNPTVLYHLAMAQRAAGRGGDAKDTLRKALSFGDFPERGDAEKLQRELR